MQKNIFKRMLSFMLSLCLLIGGLGASSVEIYAGGAGENVIYVDSDNGSDENNGLTDTTPVKTMKAAYGKIPEDNVKATIVVMSEIQLAPDQPPYIYENSAFSANADFVEGSLDLDWIYYRSGCGEHFYGFPEHNGEVVITSKIGDKVYENGALNFNGKSYYLYGHTTFENIKITKAADYTYARYHDLTLGDGLTKGTDVTYCPSKYIFTGITHITKYTNGTKETDFQMSEARDVCFTMNSGNVLYVYGGNRSWDVTTAGNYDTKLVVNGGYIKNLYGSTVGATASEHKDIEIVLNGGEVGTVYGAYAQDKGGPAILGDVKITLTDNAKISSKLQVLQVASSGATASISGDAILNLEGNNYTIPAEISGFNCLGITGSQVMVADTSETGWWFTMEKVEMTDDSTLTFTEIPAEEVSVTVKKASDEWNLNTPLITAPAQTGNLFTLSGPIGYELVYNAGDSQDSWTLAKAAELQFGELTEEEGSVMDIDLKLPKTYTPVDEDADAYETYLQKVADLEAAGVGKEVTVVSPVEVKGEVAVYVDPVNGSDSNKGTEDAPLATIQKALEHVAALQSGEEAFKGVVVYLKGGTYNVTDTINITSAHSGKNQIPVIISAYNDEEVVISGGNQIAGAEFKAVSEISAEAYNKLSSSVRDEVVAVKLTDLGISTSGAAVTKDGANYQVFVDGEELTLSRYPNVTKLSLLGKVEHIGYINYTGDSLGNKGDNADDPDIRFEMTDLRPTLWENDGNIWLRGALYAEWLNQHIRVKNINAATGIITMDGGTDRGAQTKATNTYYYYNILEELDVPGEFYLDKEAGILYIYPISDMSTATVTFSYMQDNIINITRAESVVLNGLTIENGANFGIYMTGCKEVLVQNCTLRNLYQGARIHGEQSGIIYSEICKTIDRPVTFSEYEQDYDYTPEENFLQNCYIHNVGTGGSGSVYMYGTGNVVSHNLIQGARSTAIYLAYTKECIVEYNEITGAPNEVYDQGAIYSPHNIRSRGTHVRYNYIHDIGVNSTENNPQAIYFDEGLREHYAYGNILENVPRGVNINSGSENVIIHNIVANGRKGSKTAINGSDNFKDYTLAVRYARSSTTRDMYNDYLALSEEKKAEVKGRYPLLVKYFDAVTAAIAATGDESGGVGLYASQRNYVHENLIYNHGTVSFTDLNDVGDNIVATSDPFTNVDAHDFTLTDSSLITWEDEIPSMDKIGILTNEDSMHSSKEAVGTFDMYAPSNGNQKVDPFKVLLKWSVADGADEYTLKISKNADMSEARTMNNISRHRFGYFEQDEFFAYDTTYYWTVTANTVAESRTAGSVAASNGAVYSFKTMTKEEYLAANPLDTEALEATIAEAETLLAQVTDESDGGLYADGTHEALEAAITAAKAVMNNLEGKDQVSVNQAKAVLAEAIRTTKLNRSIQYVTFEELNVADWANVTSRELNISVDGDELQIAEGSTGQAMYIPGLGIRDILCFQYKVDENNSWHGFPIAQTNENVYAITSSTTGYFICISGNKVELQKRGVDGANGVQIYKEFDSAIVKGGEYYDIEIGAINYPDGAVGIHFKINDELIFDENVVKDTADDKVIEGFGAAIGGAPIVDAPTFGVLAHKNNKTEYLRKANLTEETTGYVAGISTAESEVEVGDTILVPVAVSHDSDETFNACEIELTYDNTVFAYDSANSVLGSASVSDDGNGTLTLADYGEDKAFGDSVYTLAFTALKAADSSAITITEAGFTNVKNAVENDLTPATLSLESISLTIVAKVSVTLDTDLFQGENKASYGKDYTFSLAEDGAYYDYEEITATMDGNPAEVVDNGDGTYTIKNVTGDLVINCEGRTEKSYGVSFEGTGKTEADAVGNATSATYKTDYTFKLPEITNEYVYALESITIDGTAYTGYNAENENYTIPGADVKGDIVITISKAENTAEAVTVTIEGAAGDVSGAATVKKGLSYTLTLNEEAGYVYSVTATMGGTAAELTKGTDSADKTTYTIKTVTDAIVFNVEKTVDTSGISVTQYIQLDGTVMWLVENAITVATGKIPTYNGEEMFWSDAYGIDAENDGTNDGAYCYLVISNAAEADVLTAAKAALDIATLTGNALEVAYDYDVNETGKVDASDAQLVWNMYKPTYAGFDTDVTVGKFLEADVNKDRKVDTTDAAAIIDVILTKSNS